MLLPVVPGKYSTCEMVFLRVSLWKRDTAQAKCKGAFGSLRVTTWKTTLLHLCPHCCYFLTNGEQSVSLGHISQVSIETGAYSFVALRTGTVGSDERPVLLLPRESSSA